MPMTLLRLGILPGCQAPEGIVCFTRQALRSKLVVILNFKNKPAMMPLTLSGSPAKASLLLSTDSTRAPGYVDLATVELNRHEGLILDVSAASDVVLPGQ